MIYSRKFRDRHRHQLNKDGLLPEVNVLYFKVLHALASGMQTIRSLWICCGKSSSFHSPGPTSKGVTEYIKQQLNHKGVEIKGTIYNVQEIMLRTLKKLNFYKILLASCFCNLIFPLFCSIQAKI